MNNKKLSLILLFLIIFLAIVLRFYQLGQNPPSLDWDEASIGYNAYSILHTARDEYGNFMPLSFRSFDDYKLPVYIYLTVPAVWLFGLTEFSVRLTAAYIGVIGVIAVYFFVRELFINWDERIKQSAALCSSFFLAISPWHLQFSRTAFEGNVGMCFLVLSLLFFLKGLKRSSFFILFAVFFILSLYSYISFRLVDPILLIILCVIYYKDLWLKKLFFGLALFIILLSFLPVYTSLGPAQSSTARLDMVTIFSDPTILHVSAVNELQAKRNHNLVSEIIYNRRIIFIPEIINGYFDHFNFDFLFLHGDGGDQHHAYDMGMLYLWDFPFIVLGIIYLLKRRDKRIFVLFALFLLGPLPAAFTTGTPQPIRAIVMIPGFQIFSAVGFVACLLYFQNRRILGTVVNTLAVLLLCINIGYYLFSYYVLTPVFYASAWQYGNKQAVVYAKQHENEYSHIIMTYAYDQPYIYYLFYDKIDPSWYQKNWNYNGNGTVDRFYRKIGKYEFMDITSKQFSLKNTLLIGTPEELPSNIGIVKDIIKYPDGKVAYRIVAI